MTESKKELPQKDTLQEDLYLEAKIIAQNNKLEFNISLEDIKIPKVCPLLGETLDLVSISENNPVLARIDAKRGYVSNNVWVISRGANSVKGGLSLEELKTLTENFEQKLVEQKIHETRRS